MPIAKANGISLYYEIMGQGPPVTLISGIGYGGWVWHKQTSALSQSFRVITFDNRGVGKSGNPEGPYSIPLFVADTIALLDLLEIEKTHLVGTSLGGMIALQLALDHPDRVDHLVLASTTHGGLNIVMPKMEVIQFMTQRTGTPEERFERGFRLSFGEDFLKSNPKELQWIRTKLHDPRQPDLAYQRQIMAPLGFNAEPRLSELRKPTLVLSSELDQVVPVENSRRLAQKIPNAQLHIIPKVGHLCFIEAAEEFNAVVLDFLQGDG